MELVKDFDIMKAKHKIVVAFIIKEKVKLTLLSTPMIVTAARLLKLGVGAEK